MFLFTAMNTAVSRLADIIAPAPLWTKSIIAVLTALVAYFAPIGPLLFLVTVLSVIDMVYGILIAKKFHKKITSKRLKDTPKKITNEMVVILATFLAEKLLFPGSGYVLSAGATAIMCAAEGLSILENIHTLNPHSRVFITLKKYLVNKLSDKYGVDIDEPKTSSKAV